MKICHVALYTENLEGLVGFYAKYFGGRPGGIYRNRTRGFRSCFVAFDGGPTLEIMTLDAGLKPGPGGDFAGYAHVAFDAGSREGADKLTERLRSEGFTIESGPRVTGDGYYESCVLDPAGNRVEITCGQAKKQCFS
jgi:lactoylglutathione lyase